MYVHLVVGITYVHRSVVTQRREHKSYARTYAPMDVCSCMWSSMDTQKTIGRIMHACIIIS